MKDGVHDETVDAIGSQSPLTDTDGPCRSAGTCIHKPENKQLKTIKNHLHEVTRNVRRQGKDLHDRLMDADFVCLRLQV